MWPFSKNKRASIQRVDITCTYCGSTSARVITCHGTDRPDYVRVWQGQRFLTCRCSECGRDFYLQEPAGETDNQIFPEDQLIDDEEALREAESALQRQIEEDNDRRFP
jgi:hypothetical protein